ncbi:hypothetical protein BsWGS_00064 [Bradybaena similaris]
MASTESKSTVRGGIITRQLLKFTSGEFDVESIHTISLTHSDISELGCIGECTGLETLDLSYNDISHLQKLGAVTSLTGLNLSANRITSLDGLQTLENLESLNVCGNLLGSANVLRNISGLAKLTTLTLHDPVTGLTNPMCNSSYLDQVMLILPSVQTLNGQRVRGKGSELFQLCQNMDKAIKSMPSVDSFSLEENSSASPEDSSQWVLPQSSQDKLMKAEEALQDVLAACWTLSQQASQVMTEAQTYTASISGF